MKKEIYIFSLFSLVCVIVHAVSGCNKTLTLSNETLVADLNETCSWVIKSPKSTTIVLQVTSLHLTNSLDSVRVVDGETLIASYTDLDQSGDLLVSSNNSLLVVTSYGGKGSSPRNVTVSLRPQASGGRYTDNGQVKLNGTALPQNDSSPVYFQLIATKGQQVQILLNDSNLTPTPRIAFYDGLKPLPENLLVELGTYSQFFPITSRTGAMLVVGKDIDQQEFFSGFFNSVTSGCDFILTSPTMSFYMQRPKVETQCSFVAVPRNKGITSFRIESLNLCQNESVTIYEGHSQYDKRIATLTNQSSPVTPAIYVRVEKGFLIEVNLKNSSQCSNGTIPLVLSGMYSARPACGKTLISPVGTITSPEYPNLYPLNANCKWNLPIPENSSTFVYVAMETAALAPNHTLRLQDDTGTALWKFSGDHLPSTDAVVNLNESNIAQLVFDSTTELGQGVGKVSKGFNVTYKMLRCGGYLTSPNYSIEIPEGIPEGESCIWVISLPKSGPNNSTNIIQFSLSHPKLSSNSSIVVLDGGTSKSGVFKFNSKQTQGYLSRTNALWVKMMAPNKVKLSYNTYSCQKKDQCNNGLCIHPDWICDGVDDCGDMTDEKNCPKNSSKTGLKTYLVVIIALMCFAFGVVLTIVIPAVYKRCRYPNYRHLQDLMEPSVT